LPHRRKERDSFRFAENTRRIGDSVASEVINGYLMPHPPDYYSR
jgi:hypothetical protein